MSYKNACGGGDDDDDDYVTVIEFGWVDGTECNFLMTVRVRLR
jgi:hypothetical protein